jgi:hypothetical protein
LVGAAQSVAPEAAIQVFPVVFFNEEQLVFVPPVYDPHAITAMQVAPV